MSLITELPHAARCPVLGSANSLLVGNDGSKRAGYADDAGALVGRHDEVLRASIVRTPGKVEPKKHKKRAA
jgi:hypothetical protein